MPGQFSTSANNPETVVLNWYEGEPTDPVLPEDVERKFDWRSQGLLPVQHRIIDRLRDYSASDYRLEWLPKPSLPAFTARIAGIECFKVVANGMIVFPCSRWPVEKDRKIAVLQSLANALGNEWFKGQETRKKGCEITSILHNSEDVERLLETMRQLAL